VSWAWWSQSTPSPTLFLRIHFNIILPSICRFYKWSITRRFPHHNRVCTSPHTPTITKQFNTYQGTDTLELTTSGANILADQVITNNAILCTSAIRSGRNLVNNHDGRAGGGCWGDVQISTSLTPSEGIKYNVKNASHTTYFSIVLSITLQFVGNKTEVNAFKMNDTRKGSHSTRLNSTQCPDFWHCPWLSAWLLRVESGVTVKTRTAGLSTCGSNVLSQSTTPAFHEDGREMPHYTLIRTPVVVLEPRSEIGSFQQTRTKNHLMRIGPCIILISE